MKERKSTIRVALVGNPNSGKSTLFNALTGLNQRTGNYPGITVDKHTGKFRLHDAARRETRTVELTDLPGTYSLYPNSLEEAITQSAFMPESTYQFDMALVVVDASNLKRSLLLCSQIQSLGTPVMLVVNMMDLLEESGISIKTALLQERLNVPVIEISARSGKGVAQIRQQLSKELPEIKPAKESFLELLRSGSAENKQKNTMERYAHIDDLLKDVQTEFKHTKALSRTLLIDRFLTHRIWGFVIFASILLLIFQAIFAWSEKPMEVIDGMFSWLSGFVNDFLPEGVLRDLLSQGIIPGLGGIIMFIPQIAILFAFIAILEDTGYMARVSFIMDRAMRRFGLNGRSLIPLISSVACAVPAILSTRTISNRKERLITILVTPFMSCSARIPVYTLLIAVAIPDIQIGGLFNAQGITLFSLYMIGFIAALGAAWLLSKRIPSKERSSFIMELPVYRFPKPRTVFMMMWEKSGVFVRDAGKIILAISIVLWVLASYGPRERMENIRMHYTSENTIERLGSELADKSMKKELMENSYAGIAGKTIEPIIRPLGFDWKIGIAILTSFAAREVFVGTMATLYGAGEQDEGTLKESMQKDLNSNTGKPLFSLPAAIALMLFYAFALQCMSTVAVVKRETGGWKYAAAQFIIMALAAWLSAFAAFQLLS